MKHELPQVATQYAKDHTRRRHWRQVVTCLAAIVVFCTTYALILPAITLEKTAQCGKSEHTHGASCYAASEAADAQALVCPLEEHVHTEACFQAQAEDPPVLSVTPVEEETPSAVNSSNLGAEAPLGIALDTELNVEVPAGETVKIPFTPTVTHRYAFSGNDPNHQAIYGYVFDNKGKVITSGYTSTGEINISAMLTEGQLYYLGVKFSSATASGTVPVLLSLGQHVYQQADGGKYACTCGLTIESMSGECGNKATDNVHWSFANGVLTISGTGSSKDYSSTSSTPWYPLRNVITKVVVEEGIKYLGDYSFSGFTALTDISLPTGLNAIGWDAFSSCTGLTEVTFPSGLTYIQRYAFRNCTGLTKVTFPDTLSTIGFNAFDSCTGLTQLTFPKSLRTIEERVFLNCTGLTDITFSEGLTTIGNYAFGGCSGLSSIVLPKSLNSIGTGAFNGCTSCTSITIPENVTRIGGGPFYNCTNLKTLYWNVKSNVTISSGSSTNTTFQLVLGPNSKLTQTPFEFIYKWGCTGIELPKGHYLTLSALQADFLAIPITTLPESLYYADEQGVLYRVDETAGTAYLAYCPAELISYTVPARLPETDGHGSYNVVGVDAYAFYQASALTELIFEAP